MTVEELREGRPADNPLLDVHVTRMWSESQKYIIIGKGGSNLRKIGTKVVVEAIPVPAFI